MKRVKLTAGLSVKSRRYNKTEDSEIFDIPDDAVIIGAGMQGYGNFASFLLYVQPVSKK